jgi:hypothetical protein
MMTGAITTIATPAAGILRQEWAAPEGDRPTKVCSAGTESGRCQWNSTTAWGGGSSSSANRDVRRTSLQHVEQLLQRRSQDDFRRQPAAGTVVRGHHRDCFRQQMACASPHVTASLIRSHPRDSPFHQGTSALGDERHHATGDFRDCVLPPPRHPLPKSHCMFPLKAACPKAAAIHRLRGSPPWARGRRPHIGGPARRPACFVPLCHRTAQAGDFTQASECRAMKAGENVRTPASPQPTYLCWRTIATIDTTQTIPSVSRNAESAAS